MNYSESIAYLYGLRHHGIKLGLENPQKLLSLLACPHKDFHSVHIAGTNGKGSTVSIAASILREAGFVTGVFTSPHLVSFTERIQVNGKEISTKDVIRLTKYIRREQIEKESNLKPTFFEFVTAMAFLYFKEKGVEMAVVETGMGGRFDATNVLKPDITVITPIGLDHKEFLGETLSDIAYEKAGIIKEGVPLVLGPQKKDVLDTILNIAKEKKSAVFLYDEDFCAKAENITYKGTTFDYYGINNFENLFIPLTGIHQLVNSAVALRVIELLFEIDNHFFSHNFEQIVRSGLRNTNWPGRCELILFRKIPILLDGAHNPDAALALSDTLCNVYLSSPQSNYQSQKYNNLILVFGAMADKDIRNTLSPILPFARKVILTSPSYSRSERPERLLNIAHDILKDKRTSVSMGFFHTVANVKSALYLACDLYQKGDLVLVTGSFYTVSEAKEAMGEKGLLTDLREFK